MRIVHSSGDSVMREAEFQRRALARVQADEDLVLVVHPDEVERYKCLGDRVIGVHWMKQLGRPAVVPAEALPPMYAADPATIPLGEDVGTETSSDDRPPSARADSCGDPPRPQGSRARS